MDQSTKRDATGVAGMIGEIRRLEEENKNLIEYIKKNTDLCNTFCCYENCEECVSKFIKSV